ncbi:MAG TPA: ATP-binding protein [Vicinamibacteria bacterium]
MSSTASVHDWLAGGGEMAELIRSIDWSRTPLGPMSAWPSALRTTVGLLLRSRFPMLLWWGPSFVQFYNDAYHPIPGAKHPGAMGQPARECWAEIWHVIGPMVEAPFSGQSATWSDDLALLINRKGFLEETHFKVAYSPVPDESVLPTGVGGVLATVAETTEQVFGQRQLRTLRDLAARAAKADCAEQACRTAAATFDENAADVPFALFYLVDADGGSARLAASCGFGELSGPANPPVIDLRAPAGDGAWPLGRVLGGGAPEVVGGLRERFATLPTGSWQEAPECAIALPIAAPDQPRAFGVLVAGCSPHRALDEGYRSFFELAAAQVVTAIRNALAYEEQRLRAERLAEIDRAKTAFFSNVSHEFRTPLTLILAPLEEELAERAGPLAAEGRERLEAVHRNARRLLRLVNTLLDFSRIEAGRLEARYEPTDLAAYTAELASVFRSAVEKAGLAFEVDCPPLPAPFHVDRDMWEKVVLNLLSNAFKHTFAGGIRVSLRGDGEGAVLHVSDTGVGIPPQELPHVFERFHRVKTAKSRSHEGAGIGLALVQELVRLHGGEVEVESEEGRGTSFRVAIRAGHAHLPAERVAGGGPPRPPGPAGADLYVDEALGWLPDAAASARDAAEAGEFVRPRVIWADDNADMRAYVRRLLADRYEVAAFPDGRAALEAARQEPPALVLADVMMPGLDGFGLLRALREDERTRALPVVLLSARAGEEARAEALEAGADDYLVKPFSARVLLARIAAQVDAARARAESERAAREREGLFRAMADAAPTIIWTADAEGRITYASPRWYAYTGLTPEENARGWAERVVHPDDYERCVAEWQRALAEGSDYEIEVRNRRADGTYRWFVTRASPRRDAGGRVEGWFGATTDIHELKELQAAQREADRRKDEFLATLAHELRNPLAPIRTAAEVLRLRGVTEAQGQRARDIVARQSARMARLIDDLLDVSRITTDKLELRRERTNLATVVQAAVETIRPTVERFGHALLVSLPEDPLYLDADLTRVAQILSNLLDNAAKYTPRGGRLTLDAAREAGEAVIRVRDNGVGIPPDLLPRVFEMFTQADRSLERSRGGLGIGLTLARRLAEMHGGRIEARSEGAGQGSEFTVRLPLAAEEWSAPPAEAAESAWSMAAGGLRILVADDNEDAAEGLEMLLRSSGHVVRTVHDGRAALAAAGEFRPEVALLDIGMPVLNGYEVAARIRTEAWGRGMVLVALTGWGQDADRARSAAAGFDHHVLKPVEPAALQALLTQIAVPGIDMGIQ